MTNQVIGEGVIKLTADSTGVAGAMAQVRADAKATGDSVGKAMSEGSKNAAKGIDAYIAKLEQSAATVGKSAREIKLLELANRGATQAQLQAADAALKTVEAGRQQQQAQREAARASQAVAAAQAAAAAAAAKGTSGYFQLAQGQKLSAYQAQQLSFQLNDLFVQIASGQSPITALIQQGSQLNGQFGGLRGTIRALGQAFTLTRVLIGGVVGAIAAVGFAAAKGAQQSADLAKALTLTGNAAGITEGQFNAASAAISASTGTTIGSTRETLQALVASGKLSGSALEGAARATQGLAKVTGQETGNIVKQFVDLANNVGKGAEELNQQYNFLTADQLRYIKTLDDQGQSQKALTILFDALNGRITATSQNLGTLESAWAKVKGAASGAIDAMLAFGRNNTPEDAIAKLNAQIKELDARPPLAALAPMTAKMRADLVAQVDALQEVQRIGARSAASQAQSIERERARTDFFKLQEQFLTNAEKRAKEIARVNALADRGEISAAERKRAIDNINEKLKDPTGPKGVDRTRENQKALLQLQLEDIKSAGQAQVDAVANQERILEAKKAAALLSDERYFAEKRRLQQEQTNFEVLTLQKENEALNAQIFRGEGAAKDILDRDRQVIKNKSEIAKLQAASSTQLVILGIQEQQAYKKISDALIEARAAAQSYFDVTQRGYDQEIANIGRGDRQRGLDQAILQIRERYEAQRQGLAADLRRGQITKKQYDDELAVINEFQGKSISSYADYYRRLDELRRDWSNGANEALATYFDESQNIASQIEKVFTDSFHGMEDALVQFVTTGKLSFNDLANSIVADVSRIIIKSQITGPLAQSLQGGMNSGNGFGGFVGGLLSKIFGGGAGPQISSMGASSLIPGFAEGIDYVPKDMLAMIHQGEKVVPAAENTGRGARNQTIIIQPPAGMSRRSSNQFAADAARQLRNADARNN